MHSNEVRYVPIRKIKVVIDTEDYYAPLMTIEDFKELFKKEPEPPRYRVAVIEVVACPEDLNVILVTECSKCPRFIRRSGDNILCTSL